MKKVLIIYATNSGTTEMVSQIISDELSKKDFLVTIKLANDVDLDELDKYELILLGSPTWGDGGLHDYFFEFIEKVKDKRLPGKSFAVFGLGDSTYFHFCKAVDLLEDFVNKLQGKLVTPSLKIDGFFYKQQENEEKARQWTQTLIKNYV